MTTLATTRTYVFADTRESHLAEVLAAAHRLGSNLTGIFTLHELAGEIHRDPTAVALRVARLIALDRWPYVELSEGLYRDPRPWFHRIAREVDGCWQDV